MNITTLHSDLIGEFDRIVDREHVPTHLIEWEIVQSKQLISGR
ncbi:hypothetical protein [Fibrella aquatica]